MGADSEDSTNIASSSKPGGDKKTRMKGSKSSLPAGYQSLASVVATFQPRDDKQPGDDKQSRMKDSDTSSETKDLSSSSATKTVSTVAKHPISQSDELPSLPGAAAQSSIVLPSYSTGAAEPVVLPSPPAAARHSDKLPSLAEVAATAAPSNPRKEKNRKEKQPRKSGFRELFLQKLKVMLDSESQIDSSIVKWSTDGNSFIIMDQNQFENHIIPTYFNYPIVFGSFVRKLYRWGFNRIPSRRTGYCEFRSPTFKRMVSATASSGHSGGASLTNPASNQALPLPQIVLAQDHPSVPIPFPPSQADAIMALLSNIQCNNQQSRLPSQQSPIHGNSILQGIVNGIQSTQQWQHPNPTMNLLNNAVLHDLAGGRMSTCQQQGSLPHLPQISTIHPVASVSGMLPAQPTFHITSTTATSQSNMVLQLLVMLMHRIGEEERQRRAQADAIQDAIILTLGQISRQGVNRIDEEERQRRALEGLRQALSRSNNNSAAQNQQGLPAQAPVGDLNFQADRIAAILQAAFRRCEAEQPEENAQVDLHNNNQGNIDDDEDARKLSPGKKRKSPDNNSHNDDEDDDSWNDRLRPRKK